MLCFALFPGQEGLLKCHVRGHPNRENILAGFSFAYVNGRWIYFWQKTGSLKLEKLIQKYICFFNIVLF
jgi:hypothetical protein